MVERSKNAEKLLEYLDKCRNALPASPATPISLALNIKRLTDHLRLTQDELKTAVPELHATAWHLSWHNNELYADYFEK